MGREPAYLLTDISTGGAVGQPTSHDAAARPTTLLGYVRNVVTAPDSTYEWPTPEAHFVVWHCPVPQEHPVGGTWLGWAGAEAELGQRHWWPLAAHLRDGRP